MPRSGDILALELTEGVDVYFTSAVLEGVDDANLAHHVPHVPDRLGAARERVAALSRTDVDAWHLMRQAHGAAVAVVDEDVPRGAELRGVDVMVTTLVERPLVVLAADCLPVVAAGRRAVAVAHAGWRGVVAGVADALVAALREAGERLEDVAVLIGPAIGPCCYAVGDEVLAAVVAIEPDAARRTRDGRDAVDLRATFRSQLRTLGVADVRDIGGPEGGEACTSCDGRWYSHRRDRRSGRQAGIVVRRGSAAPGGSAA